MGQIDFLELGGCQQGRGKVEQAVCAQMHVAQVVEEGAVGEVLHALKTKEVCVCVVVVVWVGVWGGRGGSK